MSSRQGPDANANREDATGFSGRNEHVPYDLPPDVSNKKMVAGILALLAGGFGVHKFYLGYTNAGIIMLLAVVLTCGFGAIVIGPIAMIEGIMYLTKSDEEFYETYIRGKKEWF